MSATEHESPILRLVRRILRPRDTLTLDQVRGLMLNDMSDHFCAEESPRGILARLEVISEDFSTIAQQLRQDHSLLSDRATVIILTADQTPPSEQRRHLQAFAQLLWIHEKREAKALFDAGLVTTLQDLSLG